DVVCLTAKQLSSAANDARSDDTGSLTREGLTYMLKNPESDQFNPSLLKHHGKIARGWNHPQTARLLCPMRMLSTFDADSQFVVKEGKIKITATKLPTFLYDESMFDPAKKSQGCLRGYYLKRVFRHIFTGPSSTKTPKGRIHGMTSPLPRAIAYAAVQVSLCIEFTLMPSDTTLRRTSSLVLLTYGVKKLKISTSLISMIESSTCLKEILTVNGWKKRSSIGNRKLFESLSLSSAMR
ncbi:hypothetical protein EDD22DRAFT_788805, partial [Suillus occidentalis]